MHTTTNGARLAPPPHLSDPRSVEYALALELGHLAGALRTSIPGLHQLDRDFLDDAHRIVHSDEVRQPHRAMARLLRLAARSAHAHHRAAPAQIVRELTRQLAAEPTGVSLTVLDAEDDTNAAADKAVRRWEVEPTAANARAAIDALRRQIACSEAAVDTILAAGAAAPNAARGRTPGSADPASCTPPGTYQDPALRAIAIARLSGPHAPRGAA